MMTEGKKYHFTFRTRRITAIRSVFCCVHNQCTPVDVRRFLLAMLRNKSDVAACALQLAAACGKETEYDSSESGHHRFTNYVDWRRVTIRKVGLLLEIGVAFTEVDLLLEPARILEELLGSDFELKYAQSEDMKVSAIRQRLRDLALVT